MHKLNQAATRISSTLTAALLAQAPVRVVQHWDADTYAAGVQFGALTVYMNSSNDEPGFVYMALDNDEQGHLQPLLDMAAVPAALAIRAVALAVRSPDPVDTIAALCKPPGESA